MKRSLSILLGSLAVVALVGAGCGKKSNDAAAPEGNNEDGAAMAQEVKVGYMGPLSGDAVSYGESTKRAVELALADSGLENVEVVYQDSRCEAKEAANAVNALVNVEKVAAIVGELCSGATLAAAPVATEAGVVMISPASTAPTVSEQGEYVFRTVPSDALQGDFGAQLVYDDGHRKLAVVYINDDYGNGFNDVLNSRFPELGGELVASEGFSKGDVDMRTQLTKVKDAGADAVYIISNSPDAAVAVLKQITELGLDVAVYGSEGLKAEDVISGAKEAAEGLIVSSVSGGTEDFVSAHKAAYEGAEPGPFAAQAYDAMTAILDAVESGAGTGEEIKNFLNDHSFEGVTGMIDFDENGDVGGVYQVFEAKDGAFVAR